MRVRSAASEAWRNLVTGTTRLALWSLLFVLVVVLLAGADSLVVSRLLTDAANYQASGASVVVVKAPAGIDGAVCESLTRVSSVNGAGAIRQTEPSIGLAALPGVAIPQWDATPGFQEILAGRHMAKGSVLMSSAAAALSGLTPGTVLPTTSGPLWVDGLYSFPEDGRLPELGYAVVDQTPALGAFDQCWVDVWPQSDEVEALVRIVLRDNPSGSTNVTFSQLNPTLGERFTGASQYSGRVTRFAPIVASFLAFLLGLASVTLRRTELATALHFGMTRPALVLQMTFEAMSWAVVGTVLCAPVLVFASLSVSDAGTLRSASAATLALAAVSVVFGAGAACFAVRERALFRYQRR